MTRRLMFAFLVIVLTAFSGFAQEETTSTNTSTSRVGEKGESGEPVLIRDVDSNQTRQELGDLLRRLPPEVGKVLKLDPTLWTNEAYLKHYPGLAAFVAEHPEVVHSPRFYLQDIYIPGDQLPESAGMSFWRDMLQGVMIFAFLLIATYVLAWLVRTLVEQRRWSRISRTQAEVHSKLLDRFASNEELLAYIQTPTGRRFLESSPAVPQSERPVSAPIGRILWSVQVGLVVGAAGLGLKLISWSLEKDAAAAIAGVGVLAIAVGIGFVASAGASYILSRKLGLWTSPAAGSEEVGR